MTAHVYDLIRAVKSRLYLPEGQTSITENEIVEQINGELMTSVFVQMSKLQSDYSTVRKTIRLQNNSGVNLYPMNLIPIPTRAYGNGIIEIKYINDSGTVYNLPLADTADYEEWVKYSNKFPYSFFIISDGIQLLSRDKQPIIGSIELFYTLEPLEVVYPPDTANLIALPIHDFSFDATTNRCNVVIDDVTYNTAWITYVPADNGLTYKLFDIISKKSGQPISVDLPFTRTSTNTLMSYPDILTALQMDNIKTFQTGGFPANAPYSSDFYLVPSGITDRIPVPIIAEFWLTTLVAKILMSMLGDTEAFQQLSKDAEDERKDLISVLSRRVNKETYKFVNNTLMNSIRRW